MVSKLVINEFINNNDLPSWTFYNDIKHVIGYWIIKLKNIYLSCIVKFL